MEVVAVFIFIGIIAFAYGIWATNDKEEKKQ